MKNGGHFKPRNTVSKGKEFIDWHCIFKDNLVIPSIWNYFNNSETPIIAINITNQLGLLYLTLIYNCNWYEYIF